MYYCIILFWLYVSWLILTYVDVCYRLGVKDTGDGVSAGDSSILTHVTGWRMLTYDDVCYRLGAKDAGDDVSAGDSSMLSHAD